MHVTEIKTHSSFFQFLLPITEDLILQPLLELNATSSYEQSLSYIRTEVSTGMQYSNGRFLSLRHWEGLVFAKVLYCVNSTLI